MVATFLDNRNFRNWLSKNRQHCDFWDFSQTRDKSQFLQLRANVDISEALERIGYNVNLNFQQTTMRAFVGTFNLSSLHLFLSQGKIIDVFVILEYWYFVKSTG